VADRLKVSGLKKGAVNRPSPFVVRLRIAPVALSFRTTAAPGTAAPLESITVPLMDPVVDVWASAKGSEMKLATVKPKAVAKTSFRLFLLMQSCMTHPPHLHLGSVYLAVTPKASVFWVKYMHELSQSTSV
jgi:hypothetical protein